MLQTPPYHFSTAACPPQLDGEEKNQILYRGSIPALRNLPFLRKLGVKTIVYLKKKQLKDDENIVKWARRNAVGMKWLKVDKMSEESLGVGKSEVGETLKLLLDTSLYPLYLADIDGISHTTVMIACLRKLQGWSMESITSEIERFEPEYEDYPILSFITSYLTTGSSTDTLTLPPGPYPTWLWPSLPSPLALTQTLSLQRTSTINRDGKDRENTSRDKERERTTSSSSNSSGLPFVHPLSARKHPTMRLTFPPVPAASAPTSSMPPPSGLSRVNSRRDPPRATPNPTGSPVSTQDNPGLVGTATSLLSAGLSGFVNVLSGELTESPVTNEPAKLNRMVSFHDERQRSGSSITGQSSVSGSPEKINRSLTRSSSGSGNETQSAPKANADDDDDADFEGEDGDVDKSPVHSDGEPEEDEDYDDDEEEEEDDEDEPEPTSLHISALDLAGYG